MDPSARAGVRPGPWRSRWFLPAVALIQSLVVLGPALGSGLVIRYDMAWAPDPRWTPFVLGIDTPAPRAVPSDAVAVALGSVIGSSSAQSVILVGILMALGLGAARLAEHIGEGLGVAPQLVALTAAVWNPLVRDRLLLGQWTILLGVAVLPWALRACLRIIRQDKGRWPLSTLIVLAGLGGANTLTMVAISVLSLMGVEAVRRRVGLADALIPLGVVMGMAAVWALPALVGRVVSRESGAHVFAPVADTPFGVIGSLVSGGAVWNTAVHAPSRSVVVVSAVAAVMALVAVVIMVRYASVRRQVGLISAVGLPTVLVLLSAVPVAQPLWSWLVTALPGGGILRDSQKLIAAWVITSAVGLALATEGVRRHWVPVRGPVTVLLVLAPVALSPLLAWGAGGQLSPVQVPESYRHSVDRLNQLPPGDVGILPWNQYRRYGWNDERISLTLMPRLVDRVVVYDDSLPLRGGVVAGESDRAATVTRLRENGVRDLEAFADVGVRYVAVERDAMGSETAQLDPAGDGFHTVIDDPDLMVVDLGTGQQPSNAATPTVIAGWFIFGLTAVAVGITGFLARLRREEL